MVTHNFELVLTVLRDVHDNTSPERRASLRFRLLLAWCFGDHPFAPRRCCTPSRICGSPSNSPASPNCLSRNAFERHRVSSLSSSATRAQPPMCYGLHRHDGRSRGRSTESLPHRVVRGVRSFTTRAAIPARSYHAREGNGTMNPLATIVAALPGGASPPCRSRRPVRTPR